MTRKHADIISVKEITPFVVEYTYRCANCGQIRTKALPKKAEKPKYCSRACMASARSTLEHRTARCHACGEIFTAAVDGRRKFLFCSRKCRAVWCAHQTEKLEPIFVGRPVLYRGRQIQ